MFGKSADPRVFVRAIAHARMCWMCVMCVCACVGRQATTPPSLRPQRAYIKARECHEPPGISRSSARRATYTTFLLLQRLRRHTLIIIDSAVKRGKSPSARLPSSRVCVFVCLLHQVCANCVTYSNSNLLSVVFRECEYRKQLTSASCPLLVVRCGRFVCVFMFSLCSNSVHPL